MKCSQQEQLKVKTTTITSLESVNLMAFLPVRIVVTKNLLHTKKYTVPRSKTSDLIK